VIVIKKMALLQLGSIVVVVGIAQCGVIVRRLWIVVDGNGLDVGIVGNLTQLVHCLLINRRIDSI
jgi:hypothetical protein